MNEDQTEKPKITVRAQTETFEQAKELLADLEVLNKKYDVAATIIVCSNNIFDPNKEYEIVSIPGRERVIRDLSI